MSKDLLENFVQSAGYVDIHNTLIGKYGKTPHTYLTNLRRILHKSRDVVKIFFDEEYYLTTNADVFHELVNKRSILSGLHHFLGWGIYEGRAPLRASKLSKLDAAFLDGGIHEGGSFCDFDTLCELLPFISPDVIAGCYISSEVQIRSSAPRLGESLLLQYPDRPWLVRVMEEFDQSYYERCVAKTFSNKRQAFVNYLRGSHNNPANPCEWFDEVFYRAFYYDIGDAIRSGEILSGLEHFVLSGRDEKRLPCYDPVATLDAVIPGVTNPGGLDNLSAIEAKITPCSHLVQSDCLPTVWIVVPFLHTDIMFGGFASLMAFIEQLIERSVRIGLFIKDAPKATLDYYRFRSPNSSLARIIECIPIYSPVDCDYPFVFGYKDIFICYSNWDGLWGKEFAKKTELMRPVYWIQEHEAIFFSHDCHHFLMDSVYYDDHIGIFNSKFLREYFNRKKIGRYKDPSFSIERTISYQHVLQYIEPTMQSVKKRRKKRNFLVYTRPESHAARNLFEIAIAGLREAVRNGVFDDNWDFKGIGSLGGPYEIDLGFGKTLEVVPKMPLDKYRGFIQDVDIGVSLMYAPHPSLLPYEMALAGAIVLTNEFEERGVDFFEVYEGNIMCFSPTIDSYTQTISKAVARVSAPDFVKHYPSHSSRQWSDVFSDTFFAELKKIGLCFDGYIDHTVYETCERGA